MSETTPTHDVEFELIGEKGGFNIPPELVPVLKTFLESGEARLLSPTGWLCPRCGAVNAPDAKRCECEPSLEDNRHGVLEGEKNDDGDA